jgi:hypothetical protein
MTFTSLNFAKAIEPLVGNWSWHKMLDVGSDIHNSKHALNITSKELECR